MTTRIAARLALVACFVFILCVAGCSGKKKAAQSSQSPQTSRLASTLQDIGGAPASLLVAEPMRPFFAAGLGFIILGGLTLCLGGRAAGFTLLILGAFTSATGVLFVQYPWAVLVLALVAGVVAVLAAYDRLRARRELADNREALEATAEVIQKLPEGKAIKNGLVSLGEEVEDKVRAVIDPIKEKLKIEGRI